MLKNARHPPTGFAGLTMSLCFFFAMVGFGTADERLQLPKEVRSAPGRLISISATTEGKELIWRVPVEVEYKLCATGKELTGVSLTPGRYTLVVITAIADKPVVAECVIVVEGTSPGPSPGPGPPTPVDPLQAELSRLYADESAPTKPETLSKLAALYRVAATAVVKPDIETAGQLAQVIRDASTNLVGSHLLAFRRRVAEELGKVLPTDPDAKLSPEVRDRAAKLFTLLSAICEGIK